MKYAFEAFDQGGTPTVSCVNKSTVPMGVDFTQLIAALQTLVSHYVKPFWGTDLKFVISPEIQPKTWALVFTDDATVASALGFHDLTDDGFPISHVFVKTTLQDRQAVSETAGHEAVEMAINPAISECIQSPDGRSFYAKEGCDAVQGSPFSMRAFPGIIMPNFVLPAYFEGFRPARSARFDFMKKLTAPFQLLSSGWMPVYRNGQWTQIFGSQQAKLAFHSREHSRTPRLTKNRGTWKCSHSPSSQTHTGERSMSATASVPPSPYLAAHSMPLQMRMASLGFNWDSVKDVVSVFGHPIIDTVQDLLAKGYSVALLTEMIAKFSPLVIAFINKTAGTSIPTGLSLASAAAPSIAGSLLDVPVIDDPGAGGTVIEPPVVVPGPVTNGLGIPGIDLSGLAGQLVAFLVKQYILPKVLVRLTPDNQAWVTANLDRIVSVAADALSP